MGKMAVINHWAGIMMIECLRTYIESLPETTDNWLRALKDPYLAKAIAAMHYEPNENWTIHKLAEVAGMSRSSFAQRFKEVVGMPPLTYLIDYRLRLASRYLRYSKTVLAVSVSWSVMLQTPHLAKLSNAFMACHLKPIASSIKKIAV